MAYIFTNTQVYGHPLMIFRSGLFLLLFFLSSILFAQEYNQRAVKFTERAQESAKLRDFESAKSYLKKAIHIDDAYPLPVLRMANIHSLYLQKDSAVSYYNRYLDLIDLKSCNQKLLEKITQLNFEMGNYSKADELVGFLFQPDSLLLQSIHFSVEAVKHPRLITIAPLPEEVNAFGMQYFPVLTVDENTIIYTKRNSNSPNADEDIMISSRINGVWIPAQSLSSKVNSPYNEGACAISADGRTLIFTACDGRKTYGNCDLFITTKEGNEWAEPVNMGEQINSSGWDSQPSLSADGRVLFFASNRSGGYGKRDIWMTKKGKTGWGIPVNLGEQINTKEDETTPFIHANSKQLFFSSTGYPGLGGYDLYTSRFESGLWSTPENLGYPINTKLDEISLFINRSGQKCYYAVEKSDGGSGVFTGIVQFIVEGESLVKDRAGYVLGKVYNAETGEGISAQLQMTNLNDSLDTYFIASDEATGKYFLVLNEGEEYGVFISKKGFLFEDYAFLTEGNSINHPDTVDIPLYPIKSGMHLTLENIYFDFDSFILNARSISELEGIYGFLLENPNIKFMIQGHTDDVGEESYNLILSENRAKSVYNYLIHKGIASDRMRYKGFGSSLPLINDESEEARKFNRRITFELIAID